MTADEVARRLSRARAGYQLVSFKEVALPLFKVDLEVLVLEKKEIPPIQEYVLRSVNAGLTDTASIAGFLGIDEVIVRTASAMLRGSDNLALVGGPDGDRRHRLALTSKGQVTAVDARQTQAVEVSLPVWVDGLTRKVISVTAKGRDWFPTSQAAPRGLVEIAASPRKPPGLESIPLESVSDVIRSESAGRRARREVIGITGIGKARRYAREAVALAYQAPGEELLITLVIDGEPSDEHDAAFARALARSARSVVAHDWRDAREIAARDIPGEVLDAAVDSLEAEQLEDQRDELLHEDRQLRSASDSGTAEELAWVRAQLEQSHRRERELEAALRNISVRQVPVYEHRRYLDRALAEAQDQVMIVSPWIRHEVVDDQLVTRFRRLLERDVELWLAYGISKDARDRPGAKGEADREAVKKLTRLQHDFPDQFQMARLGDTHAKVLVCDSRFAIVTSFNWLSFRGDEQLEFRDERGFYVGLEEHVDILFNSYRERFPATES